MLTPEYLDLIEFNEVVQLYNKLSIDITADIIRRVSSMNNISNSTKKQIKKLKEINGREVFEETINEAGNISPKTKEALKKLYENMASEDIRGYKQLYEYRGKPFLISESQLQILNANRIKTGKVLKNMTKTIAFNSKKMYVDAVDSAYMQAISGAIDYNTAIKNTIQKLADTGVTLKDKLGREVQLETAVRRNVLNGIQQTANLINRDIEKELGCDGYEVTAHKGARPTHADAQGKQYALTKTNSKKFGVGYWKEVENLWHEHNCKHTYFGIILGVSEPQYSKKELQAYKEAVVKYDGKEISLYDARQKQRQLENAIRKSKRSVQILEKSNQLNEDQKFRVKKYQSKIRKLCKETGLKRDYNRERVANI